MRPEIPIVLATLILLAPLPVRSQVANGFDLQDAPSKREYDVSSARRGSQPSGEGLCLCFTIGAAAVRGRGAI